ncbi:hypothetical protein CY34DRAFT_202106 [Suillus luteus UH-Slu-Lm8-n1]|uniref:Secreted protein n=1 Tax=Suillus luteus UH-Slu-Lm8-n1 TaxID=930992 RepID=A0A0D0AU54_9AGAM|nr:hypothetical protein CY34DRAFT_202106 [Suillus luteus UH-Slu-Lm8-n1]
MSSPFSCGGILSFALFSHSVQLSSVATRYQFLENFAHNDQYSVDIRYLSRIRRLSIPPGQPSDNGIAMTTTTKSSFRILVVMCSKTESAHASRVSAHLHV